MTTFRVLFQRSRLLLLLVLCILVLTVTAVYADDTLRPQAVVTIIGAPDAAVTGKFAVGTASPGNKALTNAGVIDFVGAGTVSNYFTQGPGNNMQIRSNVDEFNTVGDGSKSQWNMVMGSAIDQFSIRRSPAGGTYNEDALFFIDGATGDVGIAQVDTSNGAAIPFTPQARLHVETTSGDAIWGISTSTSGTNFGVYGRSNSASGRGVYGSATATSGTTYGVYGETSSPNGYGVRGYSDASSGDSPGVYGSSPVSPDGRGVYGIAAYGVYGETWNPDGYALYGESMASSGTNYGVYGESNSSSGYGGFFRNSSSDGVALYVTGSGSGSSKASLRVHNSDAAGGVAASFTSLSANGTAKFSNSGSGEVLYLVNGGIDIAGSNGGDFIKAVNEDESDVQFRVSSGGYVYADGGFRCGLNINDTLLLPGTAIGQSEASIDPCLRDNAPADFAEMLPAQGSPEPGDVLAIGPDGDLTQSSEAYQTTIIGVYSFQPSFLGNAQFADVDGYVPLAMLGIVPVKVSAENGAIQPGDLLVASSTPGHAMKAGENPPQGTVIGKALGPLTEGTGIIQMIVTLQ